MSTKKRKKPLSEKALANQAKKKKALSRQSIYRDLMAIVPYLQGNVVTHPMGWRIDPLDLESTILEQAAGYRNMAVLHYGLTDEEYKAVVQIVIQKIKKGAN